MLAVLLPGRAEASCPLRAKLRAAGMAALPNMSNTPLSLRRSALATLEVHLKSRPLPPLSSGAVERAGEA